MSKGSWKRPCSTTREEYNLRCLYATGKITFAQYECKYKKLMERGLIKRSGRIIRDGNGKSTDSGA